MVKESLLKADEDKSIYLNTKHTKVWDDKSPFVKDISQDITLYFTEEQKSWDILCL